MKRLIETPCCKYTQTTEKKLGEIIRCTRCKSPFFEKPKQN